MKRANALVDIALTEVDFGVEEGKYFITDTGVVKTASKKVKKTIVDMRGLEMVVLDTTDGGVAVYVSDLMTAAFGTEDADNFNLKKLEAAKSARRTGGSARRSKFRLHCVEDNKTYESFAEAARSVGSNYDKFYNTFYTKRLTSAVVCGKTFNLVAEDTSEQAAE